MTRPEIEYFTDDNTEGYGPDALKTLNARYLARCAENGIDQFASENPAKSTCDHTAAAVLAEYDAATAKTEGR